MVHVAGLRTLNRFKTDNKPWTAQGAADCDTLQRGIITIISAATEIGGTLELVQLQASSDEIPLDLRGASFDPAEIFDIDLGSFAATCGAVAVAGDALQQQQHVPQALPSAATSSPPPPPTPSQTDGGPAQVRSLPAVAIRVAIQSRSHHQVVR